jgi:hypothetical protein
LHAQFTAAGFNPQLRDLRSFYDDYGLKEYPVVEVLDDDEEEDDKDSDEDDVDADEPNRHDDDVNG